eukprot:4888252-Prorocentrum_lima.AAC.1
MYHNTVCEILLQQEHHGEARDLASARHVREILLQQLAALTRGSPCAKHHGDIPIGPGVPRL